MDYTKILSFAKENILFFETGQMTNKKALERFAADCQAVGFVMDEGESFEEYFPYQHPFLSLRELEKVINYVDDIDLLGSAIYTMCYRSIALLEQIELANDELASWFLLALRRLETLCKKEIGKDIDFAVLKEKTKESTKAKAKTNKISEQTNNKNIIENKQAIELAMLLLQRDQLLYHELAQIKSLYQNELADFDTSLAKQEFDIEYLKQKLFLLQNTKNKGKEFEKKALEKQLTDAFANKKLELAEKLAKINEKQTTQFNKIDRLSPKVHRKLNKLYYELLLQSIPSICQEENYQKTEHVQQILTAYQNASIQQLESLVENKEKPLAENVLDAKTKESLAKMLNATKTEISQIKQDFPYNQKATIKNSDLLKQRKAMLLAKIAENQQIINQLHKQIAQCNETGDAYGI